MRNIIIGMILFIVVVGGFVLLNNKSEIVDGDIQNVPPVSEKEPLTGNLVFLLDPDDSFYKSIGGFSMPETIFVDSDGNVRVHKRGPMKLSEMREKIEKILANSDDKIRYDTAPKIVLNDYDNNTVTSNDFPGKILVVNSWATWCPFCVDELPDFARLQDEFKNEIVVIAINRAESLTHSREYTDNSFVD